MCVHVVCYVSLCGMVLCDLPTNLVEVTQHRYRHIIIAIHLGHYRKERKMKSYNGHVIEDQN